MIAEILGQEKTFLITVPKGIAIPDSGEVCKFSLQITSPPVLFDECENEDVYQFTGKFVAK
jgi:hypothetical protein